MERTFTVRTFKRDTDKEAALKPLEEAAEIYGAWQRLKFSSIPLGQTIDRLEFAEEIADCVTACVNLAERHEIDLNEALRMVENKNISRGRY